ncbi:MAG: glycoside hydrolase/phage tail family protein, partial [Tabrizicola sp.]|nr:glycoside hydrolase/phage tail family protein [Tabrizicola sp.]
GKTDFLTSLTDLSQELPLCQSVSLVVSWFGSDLRCGLCEVRPKVEQTAFDPSAMPWRAGGIGRAQALEVPRVAGRSIYGGTPADASVIEAIRAIREAGREVMFYPFILMDQIAGNTLTNPWTGEVGQPALPWRGRITTSLAPGVDGSPDGTAAASAEVQEFFGAAQISDFTVNGEVVSYSGPDDWGLRRFILHYAHLCAAAGGVDAFCIGSELVSVTRIRGAGESFPAVTALCQLASDVRAILGPETKISYAADWTEYGAYSTGENLYFPLDTLWADPAIDFVGIDNYMPLSDWRDGTDHLDAGFGSLYNIDYLRANIAGGEGFDWYYDSPEGEAFQRRVPIEDGAFGEPWVFRVKDLKSWWSFPHHSRSGGTRSATPTQWIPQSKPIRFTEYGCAAIDKGTNQPNRFLDLLSSESGLPRASNGRRDDLIQIQYLRAHALHWADEDSNPLSPIFGGPMVDFGHAHAWAWDARPFPAFPARSDLWSDSGNYARGHWLNGRASSQPLSAVISEICHLAGASPVVTDRAHGLVRGFHVAETTTARAMLQPLLLANAVDPVERDGSMAFLSRQAGFDHLLDEERLAVLEETNGFIDSSRVSEAELSGMVRVSYVDSEGVYDVRVSEARLPDEALKSVSASELPLVLTAAEAHQLSHRWLSEARIARDAIRFALPPSGVRVRAGDRVRTQDGCTFRVDRVEIADAILIEATRFEGGVYSPPDPVEAGSLLRPFVAPVPVFPLFLDLPLLAGTEVPHQPHVAVSAEPWPGNVSVWSSAGTGTFELNRLITIPAVIGVTETALAAARPGVWDDGAPLRVRVAGGRLSSATRLAVLNGANAIAIGDGSTGRWEILQFETAALVAPDVYELAGRLRGQAGSDGLMPDVWPAGSYVVLLDAALTQIDLAVSSRGLQRDYRFGASGRGLDDPNVVQVSAAFDGNGLRPYPVAHLKVSGVSGSDVAVTWIRRTRIEGDSWQQTEVPLGEDVESYLVRVLEGNTILATYVVGAPLFQYPAAAQLADGISGAFSVEVAMTSTRFGPGPFRRIDIPQ